ncbi:hypothetical protein [Riemerella anatipestifer]|uniref:hypothetical protein n=1 Tax=Riemerella anatipestifer TaxID=34085 RepID=UPI0009A1FE35|nr:hypothetical protein [Riemerella anatipestifer]MDY3328004.1 hypothetical protein [Riemerella anatipestifer]MDY3537478.1 hypothetical protein [Riemerella anatipestifer]
MGHKAIRVLKFLWTPTVIRQLLNHRKIPIIIVNYNQLHYLKLQVDFYLKRGLQVVIIDNKSTYPPLLEYYKAIEKKVKIERMDDNFGHMVFFNNKYLCEKYGKGFFALTDADVLPNDKLPINFFSKLIYLLLRYSYMVNKVGFSLDIESIPDSFPHKDKVESWEKRFWLYPITKDIYRANIDTTFALYKPIKLIDFKFFLKGIRVAGCFLAKHGGWYVDPNNLSNEEKYYIETATKSSSWEIDEKGELANITETKY